MADDPRPDPPLSEPVYLTLVALAERPRHGYAILQEVEAWTGGRVRLRTATLYTALRRLVDGGIVAEADPPADDEVDGRRRYYRITEEGRELLRSETARLRELVGVAERRAGEAAG